MKIRSMVFALVLTFLIAGIATNVGHAAPNIIDFELEIELKNNNKYDIEYEVKGNQVEAKYEVPGEPVLYGQEAASKAQAFIGQLALAPNMNRQQVIDKVLSQLGLNQADIAKFDLDVDFDGGQEIDIDFKV